jgi:hypothetical protein
MYDSSDTITTATYGLWLSTAATVLGSVSAASSECAATCVLTYQLLRQ